MDEKKKFWVTAPIVGIAECNVEAIDEDDAKRIAIESGEWKISEWDITEECRGNICHLTQHSIDAGEY